MSDKAVACHCMPKNRKSIHRWMFIGLTAMLAIVVIYIYFYTKLFGINYGLEINNHGRNGIILLALTRFRAFELKPYKTMQANGDVVVIDYTVPGLVGIKRVASLTPSIPHAHRDPASSFGRFPGYRRSLPDEVEVVWQIAELNDCTAVVGVSPGDTIWPEVEARGYNRPDQHVLKRGCTWRPIPGKIFRKKLDMAAVRASEAYRKTGTRNQWIGGSRYTLRLNLVFIEDRVILEAHNGSTNPWR